MMEFISRIGIIVFFITSKVLKARSSSDKFELISVGFGIVGGGEVLVVSREKRNGVGVGC
jgi:hypothetical protein